MTPKRRALIVGATGVIGRRLVSALAADGHDVHGLVRSEQGADLVRKLGGTPVPGDLLDAESVDRALAELRPAVVVSQATALKGLNPRRLETVEPTNRLRTEGTRNLVGAAERHGVERVVAQSIAFAYAHEGPAILDESAPLAVDAAAGWGAVARAVAVNDETVVGASGPVGLVLRYGQFYGPETGTFPEGYLADLVRKRRMPVVGDGGGRFSFIHIDDAVSATLQAIEGGSGVYNVVDDEPVLVRDFLPELARALDARSPRRIPRWLARLAAGEPAVQAMTAQRGVSNRKAREELGWRPRYPSWREGLAAAGGAARPTPAPTR
jgi:nucleoside-diphosphate-sugar epimerase